jgi:hypothetical protein
LGNLGQPWATLGYLGLPWATLGYLGLPWPGYFGCAYASLGYLGLRATLGYLGLPWATLGYLNTYTGCPINIVPLPEHLYSGFNHCYLFRYRSWRTAPRLLRSNIPRSALCVTLDTYYFFKF